MNRIDKTFKRLRAEKKKAFIAFLTAGYPTLKETERLVVALAGAGVDIIELGVPFSDPMADGPVIQESSKAALERGVTLAAILQLVKRIRSQVSIPLCLMTYYNPVFRYGEERFARVAAAAGVDGVIVPDLPFEEAGTFNAAMQRRGIAAILFVAPTTSLQRMRTIARRARGFIYYVSTTGVTGARRKLPFELVQKVRVLKRLTPTPVCVGFGVSTPSQVRRIKQAADGVIVGSAIVRKIRESLGSAHLTEHLVRYVKELARVS